MACSEAEVLRDSSTTNLRLHVRNHLLTPHSTGRFRLRRTYRLMVHGDVLFPTSMPYSVQAGYSHCFADTWLGFSSAGSALHHLCLMMSPLPNLWEQVASAISATHLARHAFSFAERLYEQQSLCSAFYFMFLLQLLEPKESNHALVRIAILDAVPAHWNTRPAQVSDVCPLLRQCDEKAANVHLSCRQRLPI